MWSEVHRNNLALWQMRAAGRVRSAWPMHAGMALCAAPAVGGGAVRQMRAPALPGDEPLQVLPRPRVRWHLGPRGHARGVRHRRSTGCPGIAARAGSRCLRAGRERAEARRDWAEDVIDKEDWLDIKQRTDDRIARARKEYDRLTGAATVFGDIPPSDAVRDACRQWNTARRRAAVKAVLSQVTINPDTPGRRGTRDRALRIDALRQRAQFDWRL